MPGEFRNLIYEYALIDRGANVVEYACLDDRYTRNPSDVSHDFLLTCRQIFKEGYNIYLAENTFCISRLIDLADFLDNRKRNGRKVITSLALNLNNFFEEEYKVVQSRLLSTILALQERLNLHSVKLVGCEPAVLDTFPLLLTMFLGVLTDLRKMSTKKKLNICYDEQLKLSCYDELRDLVNYAERHCGRLYLIAGLEKADIEAILAAEQSSTSSGLP